MAVRAEAGEELTQVLHHQVGIDDSSCVLWTGADSVQTVAVHLGLLDADVEVTEPEELGAKLRELASRYRRAVPA